MHAIKIAFFLVMILASVPAQKNFGAPANGIPEILPGAAQGKSYLPFLKNKSVALFANQTSVVGNEHLVDLLVRQGVHVIKIFAPEHGFRGEADAGESVNNLTDPKTGIKIISLYGNKTKPGADDLKDVDIMVFDIQDVGVRFYTYISSFQKYLEAAIENKKPLLLLDRPNPNGFYVDGPVLDTALRSFVGMQPIPVVYGMTLGEYARMLIGENLLSKKISHPKVVVIKDFAKEEWNKVPKKAFSLIIIPNKNYTHNSRYILPTKPSPNLPNMQSVYLYPSICLFEGTAISLGRGTDKPFQQFGHPSLPKDLYSFTPHSTAGAKNPPLADQPCFGFDLSSLDVKEAIAEKLQIKWVLEAYKLFPEKQAFFLASGYFNKLAGNSSLMQEIRDGKSETEIRASWEPALSRFKQLRKKYLIYPDFK